MILGRLGAVSSTHDDRPKIVSTIRQDVVFFDGMSTDQLTNRLADDAMLMLPPLGWALNLLSRHRICATDLSKYTQVIRDCEWGYTWL